MLLVMGLYFVCDRFSSLGLQLSSHCSECAEQQRQQAADPSVLATRRKHQTTQKFNESLKTYLVGREGDRSMATGTKEKKEYKVQPQQAEQTLIVSFSFE